MGDGKNLKKYIDEKGTNVRQIAKAFWAKKMYGYEITEE